MHKTTIQKLSHHIKSHTKRDIAIVISSLAFIFIGIMILWVSSFRLPDLSSFEQRKVSESTKFYDRTGKILLYDLHEGVKRTVLASADISPYIKNATVAIEDDGFYSHGGIQVTSIIRAVLANIINVGYSQGGSTITQQVVKNTLLTTDKRISRKLKEWVLAIKLDKAMPKDAILTIYLNENPYGGTMYGVQEASKQFFNKDAKDVTIAEAAYLASIPQAVTYYSPYGKNRSKLEERKNIVLQKMFQQGFITEAEYKTAKEEVVAFAPQNNFGIKAPHFVFFVKDYVEKILGQGALENTGYKIITTIDVDMQTKAEDLVKTTALANEKNFNASNAALVAMNPKNGEVLSMVGSRDYFDKAIDGQFNVAVASNRQPGSTMKPIIYSEALIKGYTPETVVFDLPTSFSTTCDLEGKPLNGGDETKCFMPGNYDEKYRGPMTMRDALAQSINVASVKIFYLAGIRDALSLAKDMGLTKLGNADQYGLSLVLGSGEVSLLDMTNAYATFANDGIRAQYKTVLNIYDSKGAEIRLPSQNPSRVLPTNVAESISDILSDNTARTPAYGANSVLYFPTRDVAVKTGTTNDSRDAWTVGYTPNLVVGVWAGNNDNSPMVKKVAGQIVAPMWSSFMKQALAMIPDERFIPPTPADPATLKPVMKGIWQGGKTYTIDTVSGKIATDLTPMETRKEIAIPSVHSILYWVNKDNPLGPAPTNPADDSQFERWEAPVRAWAMEQGLYDQPNFNIPTATDDVHTTNNQLNISIQNIDTNKTYGLTDVISIFVNSSGRNNLTKVSLYINDTYVQSLDKTPFIFRFNPKDINGIQETNQLKVTGVDSVYNKGEANLTFKVNLDASN